MSRKKTDPKIATDPRAKVAPDLLALATNIVDLQTVLFAIPREHLIERMGREWVDNCIAVLHAVQKQIRESGWKYYVPQGYQLPFHRSHKRHRVVYGGNRTGKTLAGIAEAIYYLMGEHPYKPGLFLPQPCTVIVAAKTTKTMRMYLNPYIWRFLPADQIEAVYYIKNEIVDYIRLKSGSRLYLMSYDQGRERFQGVSAFAIHLDEEPPEEIYQEAIMRLADQQGHLWMTLTPLTGLTWVYHQLYLNPDKDPEYEDFQWDIRDNTTLNQDEVTRILAKFPEEVRDARSRGIFMGLSGLVYPWLNQADAYCLPFDIRDFEFQLHRVIDPSISGVTACLWVAADKFGNLWVYREYYKSGLTISQHCANIRALSVGEQYSYDIIDSAAMQPNPETMKTTYQLYLDSLYLSEKRNPLVLAKKEIVPGIETTLEYCHAAQLYLAEQPLPHPYVRVFADLHHFRDEARKYRWDENRTGSLAGERKDKPIHKNCHLMDCFRYACHYGIRFYNPALRKPIQKRFVDPVTRY